MYFFNKFRLLFKRLFPKTPISILSDVAADVIYNRFRTLVKSPQLNDSDYGHLYEARSYLSDKENSFAVGNYLRLKSSKLLSVSDRLVTFLVSVFVLYYTVSVLVYLNEDSRELFPMLLKPNTYPFEMATILAALQAIFFIVSASPVSSLKFIHVGNNQLWAKRAIQQDHELSKHLELIMQSMNSSSEEHKGSYHMTKKDSSKLGPLPRGISEIVLSADEVAIEEIRQQIRGVRKAHAIIGWISFAGFMSALSVSIFAALFTDVELIKVLLAGGGLGAVLGTFSYGQLKEMRVAQIALTLFQSYSTELASNLKDVDNIPDMPSRKKARAEIWTEFREGLNILWRKERSEESKYLSTFGMDASQWK